MDTATTGTDPTVLILGLVGCVILANLLAFGLFGWDKRQARTGGWRVRERDLLTMAFLGGATGAKLGQRAFRHKTRKQPFGSWLNTILVMQYLGFGVLIVPADWIGGAFAAIGLPSLSTLAGGWEAPVETERVMPHRFGPGSDRF